MKVKVLQLFVDKYNHITRYEPGTVCEFDDERAKDLVERGLAEENQEPGTKNQDGEEQAEAKAKAEAQAEAEAEAQAEAEAKAEAEANAQADAEVKTAKKS